MRSTLPLLIGRRDLQRLELWLHEHSCEAAQCDCDVKLRRLIRLRRLDRELRALRAERSE